MPERSNFKVGGLSSYRGARPEELEKGDTRRPGDRVGKGTQTHVLLDKISQLE